MRAFAQDVDALPVSAGYRAVSLQPCSGNELPRSHRLAESAREPCKCQCVVFGSTVKAVLDAPHLPGKDWRDDNEPGDGVLT
jgi:hypothetical protein